MVGCYHAGDVDNLVCDYVQKARQEESIINMKQFRTPYIPPKHAEAAYDDRDVPAPLGKLLEALTPLLVGVLVVLGGMMLFVYITANPPSPINTTPPGPGNLGAYGDSRYPIYNDIFNEASYKRLITTGKPSALGYALYISCVEYKSQLACDQFDLMQQREAR